MDPADALHAVDLDRYPIDALDGPGGAALVARCRDQLRADGACELPGFLRPEAVATSLEAIELLRSSAFRTDTTHDLEFSGADPAQLDAGDPRRLTVRSAKGLIAADEIDAQDPLHRSTPLGRSRPSSRPRSKSRCCTATPIRLAR